MRTSLTRPLPLSEDLRLEFGDLQLLNGGRRVVFHDKASKRAYVECDGLIATSKGVLLLNEGKTHFHVSDAATFAGRKGAAGFSSAVEKMEKVIASPSDYYSEPRDIMARIVGRVVVPVASSPSFSQEAEQACLLAGICTLARSGAGFATTIPSMALMKQAPAGTPVRAS